MSTKVPVYFAPLQGYTEAAYRNAHEQVFGGIDTYYTPFVRLDKGDFRNRELRDIEPDNNTVKHVVPQLIANTPDEMERILSLFTEKGYTEADINMGCPFPMLAHRHKGSGILPHPEEVSALLHTMEKYPQITFSVKMRLGWENPEECFALLPMLNEVPLKHITLHPRIGRQQYKGEVNMDMFDKFYQECKHPLIYNGDICTVEDIEKLTSRFPHLAGIMVGRGLLANPTLGLEYRQGEAMPFEEKVGKVKVLHSLILEHYSGYLQGDAQLLSKMKPFWEYLLPEMDRKIRKQIHKSTTMDKYRLAIRAL